MTNAKKYFEGRQLLIATKHNKERVIAPLFEKALGVTCIVPDNFDTDLLGTFSGEVEREQDPLSTARRKCLLAMQQANCDLAIASEGSFGPHPSLYFISADDEVLFLVDAKHDLEVFARELSTDTNLNAAEIRTVEELEQFAKAVHFPTHGLIFRKAKDDYTQLAKGIHDWEQLYITFQSLIKDGEHVYVETDMRAMHNPTRMKVIEAAALKLIAKLNTTCAKCGTPGFDVVEVQSGLPCSLCYSPTRSTLSLIYACRKCNFREEKWHPNGKKSEDPMFCGYCNP